MHYFYFSFMDNILLNEYTLKIEFPPCDFSAQTVNAIAELSDDIRDVLPYLNTIVKGCTYLPDAGILRFAKDGKVINLYSKRIAVAKLRDKHEAVQVMEFLKSLINDTYAKRSEIKPKYSSAIEVKVRDVYNLLPVTNCKKCGLPTCFAFAIKLLKNEINIDQCNPLFGDGFEEKKNRLLEVLCNARHEKSV